MESIFFSSIRSFFKSFFGVLGFFAALIPLLFFLFVVSSGKEIPNKTTISYQADDKGNRAILPPTAPVILRININGVIGTFDLEADDIEAQLVDSRSGQFKKDRVKGIILCINTPGGTVFDSDKIYRLLLQYKQQYKVPVHAYVDGLCASGGMYIACAADHISASASSIIGSVGVLAGPFFNVKEALNKLGVQTEVVTQGKEKDALNPFKTWSSNESAMLKDLSSGIYQRFLSIVTKARVKLTKEKLMDDLGARVFDAEKAYEFGYIDSWDKNYNEALANLSQAAGLGSTAYQVIELKSKKNWLNEMVSGKSSILSGKVRHEISLPENYNAVSYLYSPGCLPVK